MRQALPFALRGIDSDNGSEFINAHLLRYCQDHRIQFTRGRPYKKDDNAHIEQKNWTHVRKLLGYVRYDAPAAVAAMNALDRQDLRRFQNPFLPSVTLAQKVRVGARIRRVYGRPQTPFDRVQACPEADPAQVAQLAALRAQLDPFALAEAIDEQLSRLYALAHHRAAPRPRAPAPQPGGAPASHRQASQRAARHPPLSGARSRLGPASSPRQSRVKSPMARRSGGK